MSDASIPDFDGLLDSNIDDFSKPPPVPQGTWEVMILKWEPVKSPKKGTPGIQVTFQLQRPDADVDVEKLQEFTAKQDITKTEMRDSFWFTEKAMYRVRELLEKAGVPTEGRSFKQALADLPGRLVNVYVAQEMSTKPNSKDVYSNISGYTAA
jgi:hypothetical protein